MAWMVVLEAGDVDAQLEAGPPPRHPHDPVAEALLGQGLAVGRRGHRDPGIGMQVVHVGRFHEPVHGGVDRGRRAAPPVQAEVEGPHHLVLAVDAGIDVDEGAQPIEAQHGEAVRGQGAEVAAGALHPQQLHGLGGDRVEPDALGRGVAAGEVGVPAVGAQPVRPVDQLVDLGSAVYRSSTGDLLRSSGAPAGLAPPVRSADTVSK